MGYEFSEIRDAVQSVLVSNCGGAVFPAIEPVAGVRVLISCNPQCFLRRLVTPVERGHNRLEFASVALSVAGMTDDKHSVKTR